MTTLTYITVPLSSFLIMFVVGTSLSSADFRRVIEQPRKPILASLAQITCLPLAGLIVVEALSLNPTVAAGVLLIAACPGGSISNYYVYLARANAALSVVLTGLSCLFALVTMPMVMAIFEQTGFAPDSFRVPYVELLSTLLRFLFAPLVLGMLLRRFRPAFVDRFDRWLRGGSMVLLGAIVVQVLAQTRGSLNIDLGDTIAASASMAGLAIAIGLLVGKAMKLPSRDFWPVVIELMVQNVALATTIALLVFHQPRFAAFAAVYFLVQVPIAAVLILLCRLTSPATTEGETGPSH